MPFSSTPVIVPVGANVQVRYPTPSTWNTQVTVNVQIGTGSDPDGVTFGTKIPEALVDTFSFIDQGGFTSPFNGTSSSGSTGVFQKNTTYYSQVIDIAGIEIPVPAEVTAVSNGPKNNNTTNSTAQFRIYRNGSFDSWRTSISADIATGTGGLQPGDKIQLRVTTPNWYTTATTVTFTVGDETFGTDIGQPSTVLTRTWSITTRAQDQDITQFSFTDRVDQKTTADGGDAYYYTTIPISQIDNDAVLSATSTSDVRISTDESNWVTSIQNQLVVDDTLYVRIQSGPGYTTKRTGVVTVYANGGATYTRGSNSYENNDDVTYGSGDYEVEQNLGSITDNWQVWTEVDRYPDAITAAPIFTYGVKVTPLTFGTGFTPNTNYNVTGGSGSEMIIRIGAGFSLTEIIYPGHGYAIGDTLTLVSPTGGTNATYTLVEYEKVVVSNTTTNNKAEPGFWYFADLPINGLGDEYTSGSYDDLESPYTNLANNSPSTAQNRVATLNGTNVQIGAEIDGTPGEIRKNNTGTWGTSITVEDGDVINLRRQANVNFESTNIAKVTILGPPSGPPGGNPTGGPSSPTYADKTTTMTLVTRDERTVPYPFHATPVYLAEPGSEQIAEVAIRGLDAATTATIINSGVGSLSIDQLTWLSSVTINPNSNGEATLYVRQNAATGSGQLKQLTYRIGTSQDVSAGTALSDTFRVYTKQFNTLGDFITTDWTGIGFENYTEFTIPAFASTEFFLTLVGAGGGDGGGDVPNSTGGPGGSGNVFRLRCNIPSSAWPTDAAGNPNYKLRVYPGVAGSDGQSYVTNTGGGAGGFGYCYGGDGGNAGPGDASGAGGGGGGASAITFTDNTLIAMAGGGGGGAGAGNDTTIPSANAYGNHSGNGTVQTTTVNLNLPGDDAPNATGQGGGPGGGGGGYDGNAGVLLTQKTDSSGNVIQTTDLDGTGGNGGGAYYNSVYATPLDGTTVSGLGAAAREPGSVYLEYSQQDTTPDDFTFSTYDGATISETVLSDIIQISGITGTVTASVASPGFTSEVRVCSGPTADTCGNWESATQIGNNQYLQVRATTGLQYFTTYSVGVTVGTVTNYWDINTGPPPDTEPNFFSFANVDDAAISTVVTSEEVTISGITVDVTATATNGAEVRANGTGNWTNGITGITISNGDTLQVRITSSADYATAVETDVTVGTGDATTWTVTTAEELDSEPDSFTWIYETGADLLTEYESNTILLQGLGTTADFIVESGSGDGDPTGELPRIKKNGTLLAAGVTQTTVENLDTIALVYTTTDVIGESRVFNTKTGLASATTGFYETLWSVTTAGQFGTTPDAFSFSSVTATGTGVYTEATSGGTLQTVTISGLSTGVSISLYGTNGVQFNIDNAGYNTYTASSPASVSNGTSFTVRLLSSDIAGFTRTAFIYAGSYNTGFSVQSPASVDDPISSQWYSSITPCKYIGNTFSGDQIRVNTKFDGLPVGAMMPVFQDGTEDDSWGELDGTAASRFPSWVYCDGSYYSPEDYPLLYSVLEYEYGAKAVGNVTYFRVPDMRNRYVKGTGVIDGNAASSPGLTPTYQPTKQSGAPGNGEPGAFGGMWFVENIGDTNNPELEQVVTPATGQPAQDSEFFGIAQVSTAGYSDVSGLIEFFTQGNTICPVGLEGAKIYDVPLHTHELVSGVRDPGAFKGRVNWNGAGGYNTSVTTPGADLIGTISDAGDFKTDGSVSFNLWGYAIDSYSLTDDHVPGSTVCNNSPGWWNGSTTTFPNDISDGFEGINSAGEYGSVTITQDAITVGSSNYNEINSYIDLADEPFQGTASAFGSENTLKFVAAVDIPDKEVTVKGYNPTNKLEHTHYVSLIEPTNPNPDEPNPIYGYGNNETGGTATSALSSFTGGANSSVNVSFSALELGLQVLPGTFTLQQTKQLIPVPEFDPQDNVPLVTPYVWTKWMIKAY